MDRHHMRKKPINPDQLRRLTILEASREFAVPRTTLRRILQSAGHSVAEGATYSTIEVHKALTGDDGIDWRARLLRARALKHEQDLARERGDLMDARVVCDAVSRGWLACKAVMEQELHSAPVRLAAAGEDIPANRAALRDVFGRFVDQLGEAMYPFLKDAEAHTDRASAEILSPTPTPTT